MKKWIIRLVCLVLFIVCIALIATGQRTVGLPYLARMMVGLLGVLALLFFYNKQHQ